MHLKPADTIADTPLNPIDPRSPLAERYRQVRRASERLAGFLTAEDCQLQSMSDASPTKWHLAHTTWFFETFVLEQLPRFKSFHPAFRVLYNSYYQGVGDQYPRAKRGQISRPTLDEVHAYRADVDRRMLTALEDELPSRFPQLLGIVEIGLHHEQQHQELILTDILHAFSKNPTDPAVRQGHSPSLETEAAPQRWHAFDGGIVAVGHDGQGFAYDNEQPRHETLLQPFALASRPVTNEEYLAFMQDGGYQDPQWWLSDGWATARANDWQAPAYWQHDGEQWTQLTLWGRQPLNPAAPVCHISYYEADAYARWAGARLPTEFEWEHVAGKVPITGNFVEKDVWLPQPAAPAKEVPRQLFGDVWEWTASPYIAYPGYRPPNGALGEYNGKFMSDQWVLRGGSLATPQNHIRTTYRNFFPASTRWQFCGFRLAADRA